MSQAYHLLLNFVIEVRLLVLCADGSLETLKLMEEWWKAIILVGCFVFPRKKEDTLCLLVRAAFLHMLFSSCVDVRKGTCFAHMPVKELRGSG